MSVIPGVSSVAICLAKTFVAQAFEFLYDGINTSIDYESEDDYDDLEPSYGRRGKVYGHGYKSHYDRTQNSLRKGVKPLIPMRLKN